MNVGLFLAALLILVALIIYEENKINDNIRRILGMMVNSLEEARERIKDLERRVKELEDREIEPISSEEIDKIISDIKTQDFK